jgi:hypothetical protein
VTNTETGDCYTNEPTVDKGAEKMSSISGILAL